MKKNFVILILSVCLLLSCKKDNGHIIINLNHSTENTIKFDPLAGERHAQSLIDRYPKFYKYQTNNEELKSDSIVISTLCTDYKNFYYNLYNEKFISNEKIIALKIDTLFESKREKQGQLFILSDFKNDTRDIYIKSYERDTYKYYSSFPKDFEFLQNPSKIIENLPIIDFKYTYYHNEQEFSYDRKIKLYPSLKYTNYSPSNNEMVQKSRITIVFDDYWKGNFSYKNENFSIATQAFISLDATILIKHDTLNFSKSRYPYNDNFNYKIKDTIALSNDLFIIDSLDTKISKLILRKIDHKNTPYFGHRIGEKIKNYPFVNLDNEKKQLSDFQDKKYLIIYFWGTWCKPCVKSLPDLIKIKDKYQQIANLVGVVYDTDTVQVKEFIKENNIKWENHFFNRKNWDNGIVRELRITNYPTVIVLDKQMRIVYRGVEKDKLIELLEKENKF